MKIKKLNVISFAKFQAVIGALLGFVAGLLYSFGGFIIDILVSLNWVFTAETHGLSYGTILAFGALIGMPLIGAIAGLILGFLEALLYNIFARLFDGLDIDFE